MTPQEAIKRIKTHNEIHSRKEHFAVHITEALQMAVEALEKQTPQKPIDVERTGDLFHKAKCPRCGSSFPDVGGVHEFYDECEQPFYCGECGQALDWGDSE